MPLRGGLAILNSQAGEPSKLPNTARQRAGTAGVEEAADPTATSPGATASAVPQGTDGAAGGGWVGWLAVCLVG